jgi:hypothetical protein
MQNYMYPTGSGSATLVMNDSMHFTGRKRNGRKANGSEQASGFPFDALKVVYYHMLGTWQCCESKPGCGIRNDFVLIQILLSSWRRIQLRILKLSHGCNRQILGVHNRTGARIFLHF